MISLNKYYAVIVSALLFIVYIITMAPSVIQIDSGELAAVQATLGIAHPTGYPLFTLAGYLFSKIPLPFDKIIALNALAALWCALGLFFFIKTAENLLSVLRKETKEKIFSDKEIEIIFISGSALVLAFSRTFWLQSGSVEVYSLQIFLFNLILWSFSKVYLDISKKKEPNWLLPAAFLSLGFSNHMTTLLLLPGIAYLFFKFEGFKKNAWLKIGKMLALFFPMLALFYSYLPLRASGNPLLNWGNPVNAENLLRHFTGKQYQVWLFASVDAAKKQLTYFVGNLHNEFAYVGILLAIGGVIFLIRRNKTLLCFLSINFIFTVIYSINYDINDIDSYFLLAYISLSVFVLFGFYFILEKAVKLKNRLRFAIITVSITAIIMLFYNFPSANQNDLYTFEDYTKASLASLPENSVLFSYQWDYLISPAYYFQYVENYRRDVAVIDKELLRRSWYYNQLENNYPDLLVGIQTEREQFLKALLPFERSENYNPVILEKLYRTIMTKLVETNIQKHDYYIAPELIDNEMRRKEFTLPEGYTVAPDLFFFKVIKGNHYYEAPLPNFKIRFPKTGNRYTELLKSIIAGMLARRAFYELSYNKPDRAKIYVHKIRSDFPEFRIPVKLRNL